MSEVPPRPPEDTHTEIRPIQVSDPGLSAKTNELLTQEVRAALGQSSARVPVDRPHRARGERAPASQSIMNASGAWLMISLLLVVIALVVLFVAGNHWWLAPIALLVVVIALGWVLRVVLQTTTVREHASPTTSAALEAEGIADPDQFLTELVSEFTEPIEDESGEDRTVSAHEDPARASAESKNAGTPTSGPSEAVGP